MLILSLDTPVSVIMKQPAALDAIFEVFPGLKPFLGRRGGPGGGDAPLRAHLTTNPVFDFPQAKIDELEQRLQALNETAE